MIYQCEICGAASEDAKFVSRYAMCAHCAPKGELTEQGENTEEEPVVCVVCGRDDCGYGFAHDGEFICYHCGIETNHQTNDGDDFIDVDMLEDMMQKQRDFNEMVGHVPHSGKSLKPNMKWLQRWMLCISQEVAECVDWLQWKWWSKRSGNKKVAEADLYNIEHVQEIKMELIDIQHFLLSAYLELGMTAEEVYDLYNEKMAVNYKRQEGEY